MGIYVNRPAAIVTDPRATELRELAAVEGLKIAVAIDLVLWLEDRGFVVDLRTGIAMQVSIGRVTPSGKAVDHLLTQPSERDVEQTLDSVFAVRAEECAPDGTLQALIDAGAMLDQEAPASRDERQDEAAHLCDTAAFYDWCKREALDLEDDMADRDFWGHHC